MKHFATSLALVAVAALAVAAAVELRPLQIVGARAPQMESALRERYGEHCPLDGVRTDTLMLNSGSVTARLAGTDRPVEAVALTFKFEATCTDGHWTVVTDGGDEAMAFDFAVRQVVGPIDTATASGWVPATMRLASK